MWRENQPDWDRLEAYSGGSARSAQNARAILINFARQSLILQPAIGVVRSPLRVLRQSSPDRRVIRGELPERRSCRQSADKRLRVSPRRPVGRMTNNIQKQINAERMQAPTTRLEAIKTVEKYLEGRVLVTFFTSFAHTVEIDSDDCDSHI
jgi:hypothetical protein